MLASFPGFLPVWKEPGNKTIEDGYLEGQLCMVSLSVLQVTETGRGPFNEAPEAGRGHSMRDQKLGKAFNEGEAGQGLQ